MQGRSELVSPPAAAPSDPPNSLRVAARLDHGEGLRAAPVPEVELVIGRDEKELSSGVEGQRCDGNVALRKPTLAAALQKQSDT